jgi:hypothetical protein
MAENLFVEPARNCGHLPQEEQPEVVAPRIPRGNGTVARIGMTDDIIQHPRAPPSFGALVRTASAAAAVLFTDYHRLPPGAVPG